jgi:hypothetical protein
MSAHSSDDSGEIADTYDAEAEQSSYANVIPVEKLKNGWKIISGYVQVPRVVN